MGSSKTAQLLMTKFDYEQSNINVWLIKPCVDTRDGTLVKSRIGLSCEAYLLQPDENIYDLYETKFDDRSVILIDESQFLKNHHVEELRRLTDKKNIAIICYGLRTDFRGYLFEGSKRLFELSDKITEIKTICACCGNKALISARLNNGHVVTDGMQLQIGGNESYVALCHSCWQKTIHDKKYITL